MLNKILTDGGASDHKVGSIKYDEEYKKIPNINVELAGGTIVTALRRANSTVNINWSLILIKNL